MSAEPSHVESKAKAKVNLKYDLLSIIYLFDDVANLQQQ